MTLVDAREREQIAKDLDATLVVEAAAGTGKTTALVERILSLLRTGRATLASLVAVTFTEKAAGEMKLRLRTEIEKARQTANKKEERTRFDTALEQLEAAHIGTIHAFCADLLRERPVEACVDPLFEVAAEDESDRLYDEAFTRWFQAALARDEGPGEGVSRVLRSATREHEQDGPRRALHSAGRKLVDQRDFSTPYERPPFDRKGGLDRIVGHLRGLGELSSKGYHDDWLTKSLAEIARAVRELERSAGDHDAVEAHLRALTRHRCWRWKGAGRWYAKADSILRQDVVDQKAQIKEELEALLAHADADLAACLFRELLGAVSVYQEIKDRAGKLDFLDLLLETRKLLGSHDAVRAQLQERFSHLLVDEFQDTDPLQAEILLLLAADDPKEKDPGRVHVKPGKLFVVGDPKQSIYRFRRADVSLYEGVKAQLVAQGAVRIDLCTSFRGAPALQSLVNATFAPRMTPNAEKTQARYVPLARFREDSNERPAIVALPVPKPYSDFGKIVNQRIDESLPDGVAAFVEWLVERSGWTVTERGGGVSLKVRTRHVCLLFKRLQSFGNDVTRPYVRALEVRRIPHVLIGGRGFHEREEVMALRSALAAIEWPEDTLSVYAVLHGPFFAIGDDAILAFKHRQKHLHPLRKADAPLTELTAPVAEAFKVLGALHRGRNRRPIADTIAQFLEATRAHAGIAIWPAGEQALANLLRVLDMSRRFEQSRPTSFRAFVARLDEAAARGGANEAPVVEEGTDGVRVMTVHRAKGLEFPVVVLCDPSAPATFREPSRFIDPERKLWAVPLCGASPKELLDRRERILAEDREEALRLLYVATTRARELLVVPVLGDQRDAPSNGENGWLDALHDVVYPRDRRASLPAQGCPTFGEDSIVERPERASVGLESAVRPGLHRPIAGEHAVVWWDPNVLGLGTGEDVGVRQSTILQADEKNVVAKDGIDRHEAWQTARKETLTRAAVPSRVIRVVTDTTDSAGTLPAEVVLEWTETNRQGRPHGKRFGILVHSVLATAALDADENAIANAARIQGRLVSATDEEITAACEAASNALRHPLLARARTARRVFRETSVMLVEPDGAILEGIVDLAFHETGLGFTVVDLKTDVEIAAGRDLYARQVDAYARAIATATGEPAKGVILSV
jgi:ATP-dependent helicase/nuclease subunit A